MRFSIIQRLVGVLLMLFSITQVPPFVLDLLYDEHAKMAFFYSYVVLLVLGLIMYLPVRKVRGDLRLRDGFMVVVLFWLVLGMAGALPLVFYDPLSASFTDAVFESISGLTTTGATVLTGLDALPHSILFYRQELQWLGGMGIIVLAVAVMPMLGIGGMQLYRAEAPGPVKDSKLTPRIAETAKALWYTYLGLTIACALAFWAAGMNLFDAIGHSFSTLSTGGFSTHDASLAYFHSPLIEVIAIVFMFLGGVNFALHYGAMRSKSVLHYIRDSEFLMYSTTLLVASLSIIICFYVEYSRYDLLDSIRHGVFNVISMATTTGFTTTPFSSWPPFIPVTLILVGFMGGCGGSTGGGMKAIRLLLLIKQGQRELMRLIHPNALVVVKLGKKPMSETVIESVWGFFAAYIASFVIMMLMMMFTGTDQVTAFSAVASTMNNVGPGLGEVSVNYAGLSDFNKWVLVFSMLLGRLEVFTLLVMFMPAFWRK